MSTVRLAFSPDPAYVRTARLVAAAVARRAGVPDESLDEVRLAIGEACTRAVALHQRHGLTDLIDVSMSDGGRFVVRVVDRGPASEARAMQARAMQNAAQRTGTAAARGKGPAPEAVVTAGRVNGASGDEPAREPTDEDLRDVGLALLTGLVADLVVADSPDGPGTEVRMSWPVSRRTAH